MSKSKRLPKSKRPSPYVPTQKQRASESPPSQSVRETVESVVIAFVLAFLFRTFEAEAFVIPTGSMAPTLMGRHKDVDCPMCGYRFKITASDEESDEAKFLRQQGQFERARGFDCLAGMCPMCRYTMPVRPDLPTMAPELRTVPNIKSQSSFNGDRILVNKYVYSFAPPQRWDVVVFKYPGNAEMNYIKRLVGLPGETLRVYQGDLFVRSDSPDPEQEFRIARKPPSKVLAMRQLVHDTEHDPVALYEAGWPFRWSAWPADGDDRQQWTIERTPHDQIVRQRFSADLEGPETAWIRYQHLPPDYDDWLKLSQLRAAGQRLPSEDVAAIRPQLITDFNSYNTRVQRKFAQRTGNLRNDRSRLGVHWVSDLLLEADVDVIAAKGDLMLDLVESGRHLTCQIDLATGKATLRIEGLDGFAPTATTPLDRTGKFRVTFANIDDQLLLWVGSKLIDFSDDSQYDADAIFGDRRQMRPYTTEVDAGDLAPAGIGARGAQLTVTRVRLWRDIYYIADDWIRNTSGQPVTDLPDYRLAARESFFSDPAYWDHFQQRRRVDFPLGEDQFFVMGDNSPESLDARLWAGGNARSPGHPGGAYLERRLLIGKALCVYWPHSWNRVPGTPIPFPLFPNFVDMRLVR